ncbi:MAG: hypothetical protein Q4Q03_04610 [Bowdeniella nasicola]|nr:hypothetical protein [Bowdeniella nasicola]
MSYIPAAVFTWCGPNDLQVGLPDAPLPPLRFHGVSMAVAKALELMGDNPALAAKQILSASEARIFASCVQRLRDTGYLRSPPPPQRARVIILDAYPITALAATTLNASGHLVQVIGNGHPVSSSRQMAQLRQRLPTQPPDSTTRPIALLSCAYLPDPARIAPLLREDIPFVVASVRGWDISISPLVIPGRTPCPTCEAHRSQDADATWQATASQLRTRQMPPINDGAILAASAHLVGVVTRYAQSAGQMNPSGRRIEATSLRGESITWDFHAKCSCHHIAAIEALNVAT